MSKINAIRLINLNYNNNAIKISDETFHLNGESTLLSLRNGGGKSVLVQMMTAPFVHKRYRDAKDRPFESYFTGSRPTFILVEWALDQGAGYVMTGMMVRKRQEISGEETGSGEELEIVNLISEYKERCLLDISHLPVVEKTKKEITLKSFGACRQLFESWKRDKSVNFFFYDMNNQAQSRQYFDKLKEYQINYKEWETIIKKVNLKESGLSDLFADCRDEKGLVEKWFLDAVESKLNRDRNRMKEFQNIVEKYVEQYKNNRSKIERRDTIRCFCEEGEKIRAEALQFEESLKQVAFHENQIAGLRAELGRLRNEEEEAREKLLQEIKEIQEKREYLLYKKLSGEYYELEKQERFHSSSRDMIDMEREALKRECSETEKRLHLLECARQQDETDEDGRALLEAVERFELAKKKGESLEPERQRLGSLLKQYYQEALKSWEAKQEQNRKEQETVRETLKSKEERLEELQNQIIDYASRMAGQKTRIAVFDQRENRFNKMYGESLKRNLLGEYEPGALQILLQIYEKTLEDVIKERLTLRQKQETETEEKKKLERRLEDLKQELGRNGEEQRALLRIGREYGEELSERRKILRYLELKDSLVFEQDAILQASGRKLKEIQIARRELEQEEERCQKEYERLTQGKVLELPKEFEAMLRELEIPCVYGMEWLRKNGRSTGENQKLVKRHPFLPYSLLISKRELKILLSFTEKGDGKEVYTSFPVPMLLREELEGRAGEEAGTVLEWNKIHFYVYFNQNLLDEAALKRMVEEKAHQMDKLKGAISRKQEEYQGYFEKQEKVRNQKVTKESYQENQEKLEENGRREQELKGQIEAAAAQARTLEEELEQLRGRIQKLENDDRWQTQRLSEFKEFSSEYAAYLEERNELERCEKKAASLSEQKAVCREQMERLRRQLHTLENAAADLKEKVRDNREKYLVYETFPEHFAEVEAPWQTGEGREEAYAQIEARYQAITAGFSMEQQELERWVLECRKRHGKSKEELAWLRDKYKLEDGAWKTVLYSREEEYHQRSVLEERSEKKILKDSEWNKEDRVLLLLRQSMKQKKEKMAETCGKDEPLPQSEIMPEDIDAQMNELSWQEKEKKQQQERHEKRINSYEQNITSLSEYNHLEQREEISWETDISLLDKKQLDDFKGETVREYRLSISASGECKARMVQQLNRILRMDVFREEFYRKPLEAMLEVSGIAAQVLAQLNITVQSYQSLMEKLEVDISLVEKEKARIAEILEDYLKDVHENLGKIDHNSTITVRERPIKMLRLELPSWEENLTVYQLRINDFLNEITRQGIEWFERNENAQEYFGTQLTTKHLYDTVAGIGNVQIHLFKIEEQREYPITWADVARNSGGEGFLSAFIILSSLLCYMRRDDSDFFADRNEGKVLVMDNPFAQTNAVHLLKPLMDMAKKTNTQLICLSGLGGESIYNRFDNIYVLNLVAAGLRNSVQYVRTEHIKGTEAETVIASRIQVAEQMEMMF